MKQPIEFNEKHFENVAQLLFRMFFLNNIPFHFTKFRQIFLIHHKQNYVNKTIQKSNRWPSRILSSLDNPMKYLRNLWKLFKNCGGFCKNRNDHQLNRSLWCDKRQNIHELPVSIQIHYSLIQTIYLMIYRICKI